jgi:RNA polymerase sigma-70 factor (ECF subfamily)
MQTVELAFGRRMSHQDIHLPLIRRIAAGDEAALGALHRAYGQCLYAFALRITGDAGLAEDVVQESLVIIWQKAGKFRGESRVLTWLLGIVHHKSLNMLRNIRRRPAFPIREADAVPDETAGPDERASRLEQSRLLRDGLQRLSPEHRAALELVFYQGLSLEETARVCGCPVGTVKSRLRYAKNALRGELSRAGLAAEDIR